MNNSTSAPPKANITTIELWIHLSVFYAFLCGVVSSTGNILIIIGILRSKKLRNRFFVTVGTLTICRTLLCLQFLVMALYRMLRTLGLAPSILDRASCHAIHFWLLIGLTVEMLLLLTLVFDRALAIMATTFYRQLTMRQATTACLAVFIFGVLIKLPFSYAGINLEERVSCVNSYSAPSDAFNLYTQNIDLALLIAVLIVYVFLLVFVQRKVRELRNAKTSGTALVQLKRQLKLMPMLRNLVFAHCSFALMSKILRTLAGVYDNHPEASARFTAYGGVFSTIDLFSNMLALLWSNNDIRRASLPWCKFLHSASVGGGNDVTIMPTTANPWKTTKVQTLNGMTKVG